MLKRSDTISIRSYFVWWTKATLAKYLDFRIRKDSRQGGAPCRPAQTQVVGNDQVTLLDHSYMTPPDQWDRVRRYSKAVAKHSANADFIDAR